MNAREKRTLDRLREGIAQLKREKFQLLQLIAAAPVGFALLDEADGRALRRDGTLQVSHAGEGLLVLFEQLFHRE